MIVGVRSIVPDVRSVSCYMPTVPSGMPRAQPATILELSVSSSEALSQSVFQSK